MPKEDVSVVERGDIYFFIRPDVETEEVRGPDEVQRFYMILNPDGDSRFREIIVGQKRLPEIGRNERLFAFVDKVYDNAEGLITDLGGGEYQTKTRGEREEKPARAVGEGRYVLAQHGSHSHLAYHLELPEKPGEVQQELRVREEGSYVISVRNPDQGSQFTDEKPDFPKEIKEEFGDNKFARHIDPRMLDYEHTEFILIGAKESPEEELGLEFDIEDEELNESELVNELSLQKGSKRLQPVERGRWD